MLQCQLHIMPENLKKGLGNGFVVNKQKCIVLQTGCKHTHTTANTSLSIRANHQQQLWNCSQARIHQVLLRKQILSQQKQREYLDDHSQLEQHTPSKRQLPDTQNHNTQKQRRETKPSCSDASVSAVQTHTMIVLHPSV